MAKKVKDDEKKTQKLSVRMSELLFNRLNRAANLKNMSVSEYVVNAVITKIDADFR